MSIFIDHVNAVLGKLRETPITALTTDVTTEAWRAQEAVKQAVRRVWNSKQWSFKVRETTLATVSGTTAYALPAYIGEIFGVKSSEEPYVIPVLGEISFDKMVPHPTATGRPRAVRVFDVSGVSTQPATAGVVSVVSSSAADSTQKVVVKGLVSDIIRSEELSLAGTGTVSGTLAFSKILAVSKSATTAGVITISSGATTLAIMAPGDVVHQRRFLRVFPNPDAVYTLTIKYFSANPNLVTAYEDTEIPVKWDYVVDQYAFALALQAKGKEQAEEFASQFNVAGKLLETDMAKEEFAMSEEILLPSGMGEGSGGSTWGQFPGGYVEGRPW